MKNVVIESRRDGKGRSFNAVLLASVKADPFWSGGAAGSDNLRPVWAMFGGSDNELRAFIANLRLGRKALMVPTRPSYRDKANCLETLKSVGYEVSWQREEEGSLATVFLPGLFQLDPGMVDPSGVNFIVLPSVAWYEKQQVDIQPMVEHAARCGYDLPPEKVGDLATMAYLFAAYLDRRTRCPLIADGRFFIQILLASLEHKLASFSTNWDRYGYRDRTEFGMNHEVGYHETDTSNVGLKPGVAFLSSHENLETLLAREVAIYFDKKVS